MYKEFVIVKCTNCKKINKVTYMGNWTTEDGETYKKEICSKCNTLSLINRKKFEKGCYENK